MTQLRFPVRFRTASGTEYVAGQTVPNRWEPLKYQFTYRGTGTRNRMEMVE